MEHPGRTPLNTSSVIRLCSARQRAPVGASLTFAQVCVDAHVARRARQTLVLPVRDVPMGLRVDILLR